MSGYVWLAIPAVLLIVFIGMYNGLVSRKNQVESVYSTLDAMLQKRYDLIPNLVETVKGYAAHERDVFADVARLRTLAMTGPTAQQRSSSDEKLSQTLGQLFAVAENYPQLKADRNFLQLQAALNETEEQISAARRAFNASVTDYNNAVEMFPTSIVANMMGYKRKQWFEIADAARQNPDLSGKFG